MMTMTRQEINVEIDEATGEVKFEAHGIKGSGCLAALQQFIAAVGEADGAPTPTHEMRETAISTKAQGRR